MNYNKTDWALFSRLIRSKLNSYIKEDNILVRYNVTVKAIGSAKMAIPVKNKNQKPGNLTALFWWNEKCSAIICNRFITDYRIYRSSRLGVDFIEYKTISAVSKFIKKNQK